MGLNKALKDLIKALSGLMKALKGSIKALKGLIKALKGLVSSNFLVDYAAVLQRLTALLRTGAMEAA
jgi:hypothetical protein